MAISKGTTTTIDSTSPSQDGLDCARISDTQMIAAYSNSTGAPHLGAMVLDINTGTKAISLNTEYTFTHAHQLDEISMARMSATKFMFVNRVGKARILNVSGTVITAGPIGSISSFSTFGATRLLPISSTTCLYTYGNGSDILARVLTIDGSDNVTEGNVVTVALSTGIGIGIYDSALYSASKACIVFQDDASANFYLMGQLVSISGTTLTLDGSKQTLYNANQGWNSSCAAAELSTSEIVTAHNTTTGGGFPEKLVCLVISLSGSTLSAGATLDVAGSEFIEPFRGVATNSTTILFTGGSVATQRTTQIIKDGTTLSHTGSDFVNITVGTRIVFDSIKKIADDFALVCTLGTKDGTVVGSDAVVISATHIWLSTDGGATYTDIGDSATWQANLVGGVVVIPGTAYQTIFAAVGTNLYKTVNGGAAWTLETAVGYEVDFIDLEKDNSTVFLAKRDAAGANRASLWDSVGASLTHINTGKSTTGGATSGGDVV